MINSSKVNLKSSKISYKKIPVVLKIVHFKMKVGLIKPKFDFYIISLKILEENINLKSKIFSL